MWRLPLFLPLGLPLGRILALAAACAGCHHAQPLVATPSQAPVSFLPPMVYPDIIWKNSLEEARALSADEHKPLIIFIRAAWSRASVVMDSTIWKDSRVLAEASHFIAARVDLTSQYGEAIPDWLKPYDVTSVPTTIIVTTDGRITGRFIMGTAHAPELAAAMKLAE